MGRRWRKIIFDKNAESTSTTGKSPSYQVAYICKFRRESKEHFAKYCGSCWAHGALSSLADRIKIARKGKGDEINLSIQYILNCGSDVAGSCHGGSHSGTYEFIKTVGYVPFDTCMPYIGCSAESSEGICKHVDTGCNAYNTCRTCDTFGGMGGKCIEIDSFPNATVAEYGSYSLFEDNKVHKIKSEIFARGPVAAGVNALPLVNYKGGIVRDRNILHKMINHVVSIVGWGKEGDSEFWIVRNSWGKLHIQSHVKLNFVRGERIPDDSIFKNTLQGNIGAKWVIFVSKQVTIHLG